MSTPGPHGQQLRGLSQAPPPPCPPVPGTLLRRVPRPGKPGHMSAALLVGHSAHLLCPVSLGSCAVLGLLAWRPRGCLFPGLVRAVLQWPRCAEWTGMPGSGTPPLHLMDGPTDAHPPGPWGTSLGDERDLQEVGEGRSPAGSILGLLGGPGADSGHERDGRPAQKAAQGRPWLQSQAGQEQGAGTWPADSPPARASFRLSCDYVAQP